MLKTKKKVFCLLLVPALIIGSEQKARADAVFSPSSLANAIATVSELSSQLGQITETLQKLKDLTNIQQKISEIIGRTGANYTNFSMPGLGKGQTQSIGSVLGVAGMGLTLYNAGKNLPAMQESLMSWFNNGLNNQTSFSMARGIYNQFNNLHAPTNMNANTLLNETEQAASIFQGAVNTATSNRLLNAMLYTNTTTPGTGIIQRTNIMRGLFREQASLGGMEAGIAAQTSATTSSEDILAQFSSQVTKSKDLRGDIQANSAAALSLYQTITQQTMVTAWLVHLRSVENTNHQNLNGSTLKWTDSVTGR